MAGAPLCLSGPLYAWNTDTKDEYVSFDELHQRVVHQQRGGFCTTDIVEEGKTPDGLFLEFEQEGLRLVRFSPDGLHFAFLCHKRRVGCVETLHPSREPLNLALKWSRADLEVLNFFWLPCLPHQAEHADIVVVTTYGIELFRLSFEQHVAKSLKAIPTSVRMCWVDATSGMVLLCTGPRTLQPLDLRSKSPKLPRFDLVLGANQAIEVHDVAVMTIYDATFCIHTDSVNGRVSLRNISDPTQGTPQHDIVIDVATGDAFHGTLRLSKVDNLLVVHCVHTRMSMIFDIRHKEISAVPAICGPSPVTPAADSEITTWDGWNCMSGSTIMDTTVGNVYRLKVDMKAILEDFLKRSPHDLATVIRLLLRRTHCREHIVQTLNEALASQVSLNDWSQGFAVLNKAYRQSIEAVSQRITVGQGEQATVSLQELESVITHQSVLSEKDMVSHVFGPRFEQLREAGPEEEQREEAPSDASRPPRSPYVLSVVIAYLRSLLSMQILPHKILQCFVFDVCMHFKQEHTLQQLLHYHVLLDSRDLVMRLKEVSVARGCAWATQACLDMALRLHEHTVVADMLLHTKQYLDVVPFLTSQRDAPFKVRRLLEQVDADTEAQVDDPDLLEHVLSEVRTWYQEASLDTDQLAPPDLEGCDRWIPELSIPHEKDDPFCA
mmetsp:Transcript_88419/g.250611  ORF Transcript_88419/g.250611 Transcript_88419/m.250611 type:complete len:664 (+) Transcript_88419:86-2077(+)